MTQQLTFVLTARRTPLAEKALEILKREVRERAGVETVEGPNTPLVILDVQPGIGAEGFRIEGGPGEPVRIVGNDEQGLLYGVGKFLRGSRFGDGTFEPTTWRGQSVPEKPVRAAYFATHYGNYYHAAPLAEVERYIEEMALWGCNTLVVWFDMHAYTGIDDPAAQHMIQRLRALLRAAAAVGMKPALTSLANEAYSTSPKPLRAIPFPHHYHVELCPSKPEGMALILRWREEVLNAFADLDIGFFGMGPYDQGGCKCNDCKPWGGNGYLRNAAGVGSLVHRVLPRAKTIVSTWEFGYWEGDAEWDAFYAAMEKHPDWVDYVMAEHHGAYPAYVLEHGSPGGLPLLNFPEISMFGMWPWGGFGANPMPSRLQGLWNQCSHLISGGTPYSEGNYEDMNKAIVWQLYWSGQPALDTVREYAEYEFSPAAAEEVVAAVAELERNQEHGVDREAARAMSTGAGAGTPILYQLPRVREPEKANRLLREAERKLPPRARSAWRWRVLRIRGELDEELHRSGGRATPRSEDLFSELSRLYCAERATPAVAPPTSNALRRMFAA